MDNRTIAAYVLDEVLNQGRMEIVDDYVAENFVFHSIPGLPTGPVGFAVTMNMYRSAFPDIRVTIDDSIAEGDRVVVRQTFSGTHAGYLVNIPPTGKRVTFSGITIFRLVENRFVEEWAILDRLGLQQQLGLVPTPPAS